MSANPNHQGKIHMNDIRSSLDASSSGGAGGGGGASSGANGTLALTAAGPKPITITRRLNIKIQGSMSDFAQDGQVMYSDWNVFHTFSQS